MKSQMPKVAQWVGERREAWGNAHVSEMQKRGLRGEPGCFYAVEAGHVVGTPFAPDAAVQPWLQLGVLTGGFVAAMRAPVEVVR